MQSNPKIKVGTIVKCADGRKGIVSAVTTRRVWISNGVAPASSYHPEDVRPA